MIGSAVVVDADSHMLERPTIWSDTPARWADLVPRLVDDSAGGQAWLYPATGETNPLGLVATVGQRWDAIAEEGLRYDAVRPGCYRAVERLRDLDADGIDCAVVSGPQTTLRSILQSGDPRFARWAYEHIADDLDEFCRSDPGRLIPIHQVLPTGLDDALRTLEAAIARGARAVMLGGWPSGTGRIEPEDDRFWRELVAHGIVLVTHLTIARPVAAARPTSRPAWATVAGLSAVAAKAGAILDDLVRAEVPSRFPDLHLVLAEAGAGWIPGVIERSGIGRGPDPEDRALRTWLQTCVAATTTVDRAGEVLAGGGELPNVMWSSDYPHHIADWPHSAALHAAARARLDSGAWRRFLGGTASEFFDIPLPEPGVCTIRRGSVARRDEGRGGRRRGRTDRGARPR